MRCYYWNMEWRSHTGFPRSNKARRVYCPDPVTHKCLETNRFLCYNHYMVNHYLCEVKELFLPDSEDVKQ